MWTRLKLDIKRTLKKELTKMKKGLSLKKENVTLKENNNKMETKIIVKMETK